jgi:hypothetical protein
MTTAARMAHVASAINRSAQESTSVPLRHVIDNKPEPVSDPRARLRTPLPGRVIPDAAGRGPVEQLHNGWAPLAGSELVLHQGDTWWLKK